MTTGTGLALLGIWIACASAWTTDKVTSFGTLVMTLIAMLMTLVIIVLPYTGGG